MDDDVLAHTCIVCNALYGEHTLAGLAECMETILVYDDDPYDPVFRDVEDVRGPTLARVL